MTSTFKVKNFINFHHSQCYRKKEKHLENRKCKRKCKISKGKNYKLNENEYLVIFFLSHPTFKLQNLHMYFFLSVIKMSGIDYQL